MTNSNFRTSNMQELFGKPTMGVPSRPGQLDWHSIAITGAIVLIGVAVTVIIIRQAQKAQMEKIIFYTQNMLDENITSMTEQNTELRSLLFEINAKCDSKLNAVPNKEGST